jgi:hypothetical protein
LTSRFTGSPKSWTSSFVDGTCVSSGRLPSMVELSICSAIRTKIGRPPSISDPDSSVHYPCN